MARLRGPNTASFCLKRAPSTTAAGWAGTVQIQELEAAFYQCNVGPTVMQFLAHLQSIRHHAPALPCLKGTHAKSQLPCRAPCIGQFVHGGVKFVIPVRVTDIAYIFSGSNDHWSPPFVCVFDIVGHPPVVMGNRLPDSTSALVQQLNAACDPICVQLYLQ